MKRINIDKAIKSNLLHRTELIKKVMILKGWDITAKGNLTIKTLGDCKDVKNYDEYKDTFKPHWGRFLNLEV